jgi:hypothetical protein
MVMSLRSKWIAGKAAAHLRQHKEMTGLIFVGF